MTDAASDEMDDIISRGSSKRRIVRSKENQVEEEEGEGNSEPSEPAAKEPIKAVKAAKFKEVRETALAPTTMEELDLSDILDKNLPKASESVKTLGSMMTKYGVGENPNFKLQLWRTWPKMYPGGVKADGFYDTWEQALTEELIQSEYGGGMFRVHVMGPHPTSPNALKHYDSITLNLAGDPKYDRQPRATQGQNRAREAPAPSPMMHMGGVSSENPKLAETAMKLAVDMADKEREERRRVEDRSAERLDNAERAMGPALESERRRADDMLRMERERSEMQVRGMQDRLDEQRSEYRRLAEKMEAMESSPKSSPAEEMLKLMPYMQQKPTGDEGKSAERMMESVLDKHRVEMEAMRDQSQRMIENISKQNTESISSMRAAHQSEIASMRETIQREVSAERDSGRRREERVEDQLKAEREERRRDQERAREVLAEREQAAKDRAEMQNASTSSNWEARHQSVVATYENRLLWQQQEIDRIKSELNDAKSRATDNSDPIAIVHKAKEIREAIGGPEQPAPSGNSGGGIGMGGMEDWKSMMAEGLSERAPAILQALGGLLSGQPQAQAAQQQQYTPGQVVQTPQGEMVVIQTPQGLALTPRASAPSASNLLPQGQSRRRIMPDADDVPPRRRNKVSAVPNFADLSGFGDPLPKKRRPPWEGGGGDDNRAPDQAPPVAQQQRQPVRTSRPPEEAQPQRIARQMTAQERQALGVIAKMVHDSVMNADEPDEFADRTLKEWSPDMIKRVIASYSPDDIARGILETQPHSAGATPAGQSFIRSAFARIEESLK